MIGIEWTGAKTVSVNSSFALLQKFGVNQQIVTRIAIVHEALRLLLLQRFGKVEVLSSDVSDNVATLF